MCGLFGVSSNFLTQAELERAWLLGYLSFTRGSDSTGLAYVGKKSKKPKSEHIAKAIPSGLFLYDPDVTQFMKRVNSNNILLGHTRAATTGAVNDANAQPFWVPPIMGSHNGMFGAFNPSKNEDRSDSYYFFQTLANEGLKEALDVAYMAEPCMYALVWFDFKTNKLHMLRNNKRPLHRMSTAAGQHYWASEKWMLDVVDSKSTTVFQPIVSLTEDTLYTQELGDKHWSTQKIIVPKKHYQYTPLSSGVKRYPDFSRDYDDEVPWYVKNDYYEKERFENAKIQEGVNAKLSDQKARAAKELDFSISDPNKYKLEQLPGSNVILLPDLTTSKFEYKYIGYNNESYDVDKMKDQLFRSGGCSFCDNHSTIEDTVWWYSQTEYVCDDCFKTPLFRQIAAKDSSELMDLYTRGRIAVAKAA